MAGKSRSGCRRCGADVAHPPEVCPGGAPLLELEHLDDGPPAGGQHLAAGARRRGPGSGGGDHDGPVQVQAGLTGRSLAAVVAVLASAALLGAAVWVGTGAGSAGDAGVGLPALAEPGPAAPPATEGPGPAPPATEGNGPVPTVAEVTVPDEVDATGPRPVPTTEAPAVEVTEVGAGGGPLLEGITGEWSLYVVVGDTVHRIDPATGERTSVEVALRGPGPWVSVLARGDRVVLHKGRGRVVVASRDLDGPTTLDGTEDLPNSAWVRHLEADGTLWMTWFQSGSYSTFVTRIDGADGSAVDVELPSGSSLAGIAEGRMVVGVGGRIYLVGVDGSVAPYATGHVSGINDPYLLWFGCDDHGVCHYHVGTVDDPWHRAAVYPLAASAWRLDIDPHRTAMISPDGTAALIHDQPPSVPAPAPWHLVVVDTDERSVLEVDGELGPVFRPHWSPDGEWLFLHSPGDHLAAVSLGTGEVTRLDLGTLDDRLGNELVAIG